MLRSKVTKTLKRIDKGIRVARYSNMGEHTYHGGSDGLYLYNEFVGAIPPGNVYLNSHKEYKTTSGYTNRGLLGILHRLRVKGLRPNKIMEAYREIKTSK